MKNKTVLRGGLALLAALTLAGFVLHASGRPRLYSVVLVTHSVPLGTAIAAQDVGTLEVASLPAGAVTSLASAIGRYAQVPLEAGGTLTAAEVGPPLHAGRGQVQVVVPVSAAESALAVAGDLVAVYGTTAPPGKQTRVTEIIPQALVLGAYTSAGNPITSLTPGTPALVALAVTPAEVAAILPYASGQGSSLYLVRQP